MKKRHVWFDHQLNNMNIDASFAFLYVLRILIARNIEFNAANGKFKGYMEFECDDDLWAELIGCCKSYYNYLLIDEEL